MELLYTQSWSVEDLPNGTLTPKTDGLGVGPGTDSVRKKFNDERRILFHEAIKK